MTLITNVFPKLRTPKNLISWLSKKSFFSGLFEKQQGKLAQTLLKLERQYLYHTYSLLLRPLRREKFLLLIRKILRLPLDKFTADEKYSVLNRDSLTQPIHMQLSQEQKIFLQFFFIFEIYIEFRTFSKKRWPS